MKIIIPANEAKVRDDALIVYSTNDPEDPAKLCEWVKWRDEYDKPNYTPVLWSREIEPWVKVEERLPLKGNLVEIIFSEGKSWAFLAGDNTWRHGYGRYYGQIIIGVTHWFDTSLFPVPPKRDECEEAFDKWINEEPGTITKPSPYEAWQAAWKAARGMR